MSLISKMSWLSLPPAFSFFLAILLLCPATQTAQTQQLYQRVIANAGGYWEATETTPGISFTLGETFTRLSGTGDTLFTEGFQQTRIIEFPVVTSALWQHRITLFPNPAAEFVRLRFDLPEVTDFSIILFSNLGSRLKVWNHSDQQGIFTADITGIPPGTYHLSAFDQNANRVASFTFVKQ